MLVLSGPRYSTSMYGTLMVCYLVVYSTFWHKICTYFCKQRGDTYRKYTATVNTIWKVKFVLFKCGTLASAHFSLLQFAWTHLWHNMHWIISWNDSLQQISQKQDPLPLFCSFLAFGKFFTETKLHQVLYFHSSLFFCSWDIYQRLVRTGTLSVLFTFLPVGHPSIKEKAC